MEYNFLNICLIALVIFLIHRHGFKLGWRARENEASRYLKELEEKYPVIPTLMIKVEKVGDWFHLYEQDSGVFIASVKNLTEAKEVLAKYKSNTNFTTLKTHAEEIGFM